MRGRVASGMSRFLARLRRRVRQPALPLLCVAVGFASAFWTLQAASGYELAGQSWPQSEPGGPVTLTYSYGNLLDGGPFNASQQPVGRRQILGAVEEAFSVWATVAPLHFVEVPDEGGAPATYNYASGQYGAIRLGYRPIDGPGQFKAVAFFPPADEQGLCTVCGDIHFDVDDRWETIGTLDLPDLLGAAIHEIGHTLGLAHSDVREANMYPVFRRHTGPGSGWLHPDDVAGVQAIYGDGIGSVTPLARVPEPASTVMVVVAVLAGMAMPAHPARRSHARRSAGSRVPGSGT